MHTPPSNDIDIDSWSSLATVKSFDAGSTQPMDDLEGGRVHLKEVQCMSSSSLLVESLIEQLCKLLETDGNRQKALYNVICDKLCKMKLIDQTFHIEELQFMRTHYRKALFQLLTVARSTTAAALPTSAPSSLLQLSTIHDIRLSVLLKEIWEFSQYNSEFVELGYIAKGGFGRVYRARNKIDKKEYAIKKICLRYKNPACFQQSLKEVHVLATLNHPNIVSYKAAWLEPYVPSKEGDVVDHQESSLLTRSRRRTNVVIDPIEEDSGGIVFKNSTSDEQPVLSVITESSEDSLTVHLRTLFKEETDQMTSTYHHREEHRRTVISEDSNSNVETSRSMDERALCEYRATLPARLQHDDWTFEHSMRYHQQELCTLYIKMQLCECTLRQWLDTRNRDTLTNAVDINQSLTVFRQILKGVEYIHSKGIVHHDIKPSNIFVTSDLSSVQVGDFGLACLQHSPAGRVAFVVDDSSLRTQHKGEVGTKTYAAPEQLNGVCDPKSDIYSLGIVLCELVLPFSTDMERSKVIGQLRSGHGVQELSSLPTDLAAMIRQLLAPDPCDRPMAQALRVQLDQLLFSIASHSLPDNKDETIKKLLNIINKKDEEIEALKQQLKATRSLITMSTGAS